MAKRNTKTTGNKRQREQDKIRKRKAKEERKEARKQARENPPESAPAVDAGTKPDAASD